VAAFALLGDMYTTSSTARSPSQTPAVTIDGLNDRTTYTLSNVGSAVVLQTPDGGTTTMTRDFAGQVTAYTDALNRTSTYTYQYGTGKGDLTQVTYPDGSYVQYGYEQTYHHVTSYRDTLAHLTTLAYSSTGDLTTYTNALNQTTTLAWSNGLLTSVTDPLLHRTAYGFDSTTRRLTTITDALSDVSTLTYDSAGNIQTVRDALNRVTSYAVDGLRRVTTQTNALGGILTLTYNTIGEVLTETDQLGRVTSAAYDSHGWRTTLTQAVGTSVQRTETMAYDVLGRETSGTDGNGHTTQWRYDSMGRLTCITDAAGGIQTATYDLAGQRTSVADQLNHVTTYGFSNRGWVTSVEDPMGNFVTTAFDTEGNATLVTDARSNKTTYQLDALNRVTQITDRAGGLWTIQYDAADNVQDTIDARSGHVTYQYDALNRVTNQADQLNHSFTLVYDRVGNITVEQDQLAYATTMAYDALNRLVSTAYQSGAIVTTSYDAVDNATAVTDGLGHTTATAFDALNRPYQTTDARTGITTVLYDAADNVTGVIDSVSNRTTFSLDSLNRVTQETDALNHSSTFAYDGASRLTSATDRDGRRQDYSYDLDDRLTTVVWSTSGNPVNTLTYSWDGNSNLLTGADKNGTYTLSYDALDRATLEKEPFGAVLTMAYDANSNRTLLQDSLGGVLTSVYDAADRLTSRQFGGASQTPLRFDLAYSPRDQITTITRYSDLAGTTKVGTSIYAYDPTMRLTSIQHQNGSGIGLASYTYAYDLADRLTTEVDNGAAPITYSYDATNELTGDGTRSYSFDLNGNRTNSGYTTGSANQLTSDGTWNFTFDSEGNLTKATRIADNLTWTYSYDHLNRLVGTQERATDGGTLLLQSTYVYDVFGDRIEKDVWTQSGGTTTTTRFAYDGQDVWADLTSGNALQTRYLHGDAVDQLFARISSAGTAAWYLTDHLGSVRDLTDNTGALQDHIVYDPFGNVLSESNQSFGDRFKWTGRELDSETGLQYNRARYYDPVHGRWISQDPLGFAAGDPNLYGYVGNGPTTTTDPQGLIPTSGSEPPSHIPPVPPGPEFGGFQWNAGEDRFRHKDGRTLHWDKGNDNEIPHWEIQEGGDAPKKFFQRDGTPMKPRDRFKDGYIRDPRLRQAKRGKRGGRGGHGGELLGVVPDLVGITADVVESRRGTRKAGGGFCKDAPPDELFEEGTGKPFLLMRKGEWVIWGIWAKYRYLKIYDDGSEVEISEEEAKKYVKQGEDLYGRRDWLGRFVPGKLRKTEPILREGDESDWGRPLRDGT
jgi:RHS repeat-associated protein